MRRRSWVFGNFLDILIAGHGQIMRKFQCTVWFDSCEKSNTQESNQTYMRLNKLHCSQVHYEIIGDSSCEFIYLLQFRRSLEPQKFHHRHLQRILQLIGVLSCSIYHHWWWIFTVHEMPHASYLLHLLTITNLAKRKASNGLKIFLYIFVQNRNRLFLINCSVANITVSNHKGHMVICLTI